MAVDLLRLIQQINDCGVVVSGVVTQLSLNLGSTQIQILPLACRRFAMVSL